MDIYYTVYQTTNLVNGKIYIGVHKTKNPNDSYLGSNKILKSAIKKYGRKNFKKEVLFIFDNEEDMWNKEKELVNENFVQRVDTYNIGHGGEGWTGLGQYIVNNKIGILSEDYLKNKKPKVSRETHKILKENNLCIYSFTKEKRSEMGKLGAATCKERGIGIYGLTDKQRTENGIKGSNTCREKGVGLFGLTFEQRSITSKKTQAEMCPEKRRKICSAAGKKGSKVGMERKTGIHGLTKEQRTINAKKGNDKVRELGKGFFSPKTQSELGKRGGPKNKGFRWYNDGENDFKYTKKQQEQMSFDEFLQKNPHYKRDRLKREFKERPHTKGKRTLTDGVKNLMLPQNEAEVFLIENPSFRYGRTNFVNNKNKGA